MDVLLQKVYAKYIEHLNDGHDILPFDDWCTQPVSAMPQFQYWKVTLQLQILLLVFLKSLRQANFTLYMDALQEMLPWFSAMNHTNYAHWLPVHLRDMHALQQTPPDIFLHFLKGFFTGRKSQRRFSAIAY